MESAGIEEEGEECYMEEKHTAAPGRSLKKRIMCRLFYTYLEILEKTVKTEWIQPEQFTGNHVIGFWHEDSFAMNLVLKKAAQREDVRVSVLVTADDRGDYVKYILEKCRREALRMGYGFCSAGLMREILSQLKEKDRSVAIAMDGPLGPRHIPKKTTFFLSEQSKASLLGVTLDYSKKITLSSRWDHYRIPLPFSTIKICFDDYGVTSCQHMPRMKICQKEVDCGILACRPNV